MTLRPHHVLCMQFFEGKGYSPAFVQHMAEVISLLQTEQPAVTLLSQCDTICTACPHCIAGVCETDKVQRYDAAVLAIMGLQDGQTVPYPLLREKAAKLTAANRLPEVCGDCQWFAVCKKQPAV